VELSTASLVDFGSCVGDEFRIAAEPGNAVRLTLVDTTPLTAILSLPARQAFSLIFRGPKNRPLDQRIHNLEHERLGRFDLFLVPIGPGVDGNGPYYQAIFN